MIKKISSVPKDLEENLTTSAFAEWLEIKKHAYYFHLSTHRIWEIRYRGQLFGVFGLVSGSIAGTGHRLWLLPTIYFRPVHSLFRVLRKALRRLVKVLGRLTVFVQSAFRPGCNLVNFLGFKGTGKIHDLKIFELRSEWLSA